mmetsp:Transcript_17292/g.33306  ORF Transcript_17292/g.33306 Transcript_17292/m.33306 type:complete len:539 (-) Transcript_17292:200-1816(-)
MNHNMVTAEFDGSSPLVQRSFQARSVSLRQPRSFADSTTEISQPENPSREALPNQHECLTWYSVFWEIFQGRGLDAVEEGADMDVLMEREMPTTMDDGVEVDSETHPGSGLTQNLEAPVIASPKTGSSRVEEFSRFASLVSMGSLLRSDHLSGKHSEPIQTDNRDITICIISLAQHFTMEAAADRDILHRLAKLQRMEASLYKQTKISEEELAQEEKVLNAKLVKLSQTCCNLMAALQSVTPEHRDVPACVLKAFPMLAQLAKSDRALLSLIDAGIVTAILECLELHSQHVPLQARGIALLALFCNGGARISSPEPVHYEPRKVHLARTLPSVLSIMSSHQSEKPVQVAACELLYAMTQLGSKMVAVLLKFAEAILENILPLFGMYKLESRVIESCTGALLSVVALDVEHFQTLLAPNELKSIRGCLKLHGDMDLQKYSISSRILNREQGRWAMDVESSMDTTQILAMGVSNNLKRVKNMTKLGLGQTKRLPEPDSITEIMLGNPNERSESEKHQQLQDLQHHLEILGHSEVEDVDNP